MQRGDFKRTFLSIECGSNHRTLLRARRDDIPLLADYFVRHYAEQNGKTIEGIAPSALKRWWTIASQECAGAAEHHRTRGRTCQETVLDEADLPEAICSQPDAEGLSTTHRHPSMRSSAAR